MDWTHMRILVSGDSHADYYYLGHLDAVATEHNCDAIFILGDFGYWPKSRVGKLFLDKVAEMQHPVFWLAGNHEDWDAIEEIVTPINSFHEVSPNCFYAPTGLRWEWGGVKFLSVGGAFSIDRRRRVKFVSWFPNEVITEDDVEACASPDGDTADIVFSHDAPHQSDMQMHFMMARGEPYEDYTETAINRTRLGGIVADEKPSRLYHGHWHLAYTERVDLDGDELVITGLNCNGLGDSYTIIDTEDFNGDENLS